MSSRLTAGLVLGCSLFLLVGCRSRTEQPGAVPPEQKGAVPSGFLTITLHVEDMAERLDLA